MFLCVYTYIYLYLCIFVVCIHTYHALAHIHRGKLLSNPQLKRNKEKAQSSINNPWHLNKFKEPEKADRNKKAECGLPHPSQGVQTICLPWSQAVIASSALSFCESLLSARHSSISHSYSPQNRLWIYKVNQPLILFFPSLISCDTYFCFQLSHDL